jgi:hypothetical protein
MNGGLDFSGGGQMRQTMSNGRRASKSEAVVAPGALSKQAQKTAELARRSWLKLSNVLNRESAAAVVEMFLWISIGIIFECASAAAISEWRSKLSKAWNDLEFDIKAKFEHDEKARDHITTCLPAVFAQTTYRLIVDAFGPDDSSLFADHSEPLLAKLTCIVNYELFGFQLSPSTSRATRLKIYKKFAIEHPHLDQLKNQESRLRQEMLEINRDLFEGLVFGSVHNLPIDDLQLEHLIAGRSRAESDSVRFSNPDSGTQVGEEDVMVQNRVLRHQATLRLQEELNVGRHTVDLEEAADNLNSKYNDFVEEAGFGRLDSKMSGESTPPPDCRESLGMEDSVQISPMSTRSRRSFRDCGGERAAARTRAAEQAAEKRRRAELREILRQMIIKDNLPPELTRRELNTQWVSPMTDRLTQGGALTGGSSQGKSMKMRDNKDTFASLPAISSRKHSHSHHTKDDETTTTDESQGMHEPLPHLTVIQTNLLNQKSGSNKEKLPLWLEPPKRIGNRRVMGRFDMHLKGFLKKSFINDQKEVDPMTGARKQRTDPVQLYSQEKSYVRELEGLVGGHGSKALKLPTFTLNRSNSSP